MPTRIKTELIPLVWETLVRERKGAERRYFEAVELEVWGLQKRKEWVSLWDWGKIYMVRIKSSRTSRLWGNT